MGMWKFIMAEKEMGKSANSNAMIREFQSHLGWGRIEDALSTLKAIRDAPMTDERRKLVGREVHSVLVEEFESYLRAPILLGEGKDSKDAAETARKIRKTFPEMSEQEVHMITSRVCASCTGGFSGSSYERKYAVSIKKGYDLTEQEVQAAEAEVKKSMDQTAVKSYSYLHRN